MRSIQRKKTYNRIAIFGHKGLIGSAIFKQLKIKGYKKLITVEKKKLNLLNEKEVLSFYLKHKPNIIIIAAARVGGIKANIKYPFNFIYENLIIQNNIIKMSIKFRCERVIFLGSSCIYPKIWKRPFKESDITLSPLEKTNEYYAIAKISGLKLCEAYNRQYSSSKTHFITIIPPNLFGDNDNYNENNSHVLAALIRKFYLAKKYKKKSVKIWGTGNPKREFLSADDAAKMITDLMETSFTRINKHTKGKYFHINIGVGRDYSIKELALILKKISNFKGNIVFDKSYPDGVKRKVMNINLLKKISPHSLNKNLTSKKNLINNIKKVYSNVNETLFKKFKKNSTYSLPI